MKKHTLLLCLCAAALPCFGQNALIDLFRPFNKSLTPLRTDSLFVRTQQDGAIITRQIAYAYQDSFLTEWRERRVDNSLQTPLVLKIKCQIADHIAVTERLDSIADIKTAERFSLLGQTPDQPEGYLMESRQEDGSWSPVQQTLFTYDSEGRVAQRLEQHTGVTSAEWGNMSTWNYTYDKQGRMTMRQLDHWDGEESQPKGIYRYEYAKGQSQPHAVVWLAEVEGQITPVDSTVTWYDLSEEADSSMVFVWGREQSVWCAADRAVFATDDEKAVQHGKTFVHGLNGEWVEKTEVAFTASDAIFTNDPQEEVLRVYDPVAQIWRDKERTTTIYKLVDEKGVYGSIRTEVFAGDALGWEETFFAEAWFRKDAHRQGLDSVPDRSSDHFRFSYACGLPNPYVATRTLTFPLRDDLSGNYELRIVSEEGRLIFQRRYDDSGMGYVDTPLPSGFYLVTVSKGGTPVCSQKLVVE